MEEEKEKLLVRKNVNLVSSFNEDKKENEETGRETGEGRRRYQEYQV